MFLFVMKQKVLRITATMDAEDGSAARASSGVKLFKVYKTRTDKYKFIQGVLFSDGTVVIQR